MALVLAVGRVREPLAEGVGRVVERPGELAVVGEVERLTEERVPRGVDREGDGLVVGEGFGRDADDFSHRLREELLVPRLAVDEP